MPSRLSFDLAVPKTESVAKANSTEPDGGPAIETTFHDINTYVNEERST